MGTGPVISFFTFLTIYGIIITDHRGTLFAFCSTNYKVLCELFCNFTQKILPPQGKINK